MLVCEAYEKMRRENGTIAYLNPFFNPKTNKQEATVVLSDGLSMVFVQVFDTPNTECVEPIFSYILNKE